MRKSQCHVNNEININSDGYFHVNLPKLIYIIIDNMILSLIPFPLNLLLFH